MRIQTCYFYRTEVDKRTKHQEKGIIINEGDGPILDMKGKHVEEVWDYSTNTDYVITIPEEN